MVITVTEYPSSCASSRQYLVNIHGYATINTTVTAHPAVVHYWLRYILRRPRLIFSLSVQHTRTNLNTNDNPAAVLQISVYRYCLVFQINRAAYVPGILRRLLIHPRATFVGLYPWADAVGLFLTRHMLVMMHGMPMELRDLVGQRNGFVAEIAARTIGVDMEWDWEVCRRDWEVEELSDGQIKHLVVFGYVCFELGVVIRAWRYNRRLFH